MLTSPKLSVPDQSPRRAAPFDSGSSSSASSARRAPLLHGREAALERALERRAAAAPLRERGELRLAPARLGLDQRPQPVLVLLAEARGLERTRERADQLLGELELARVGRARLERRELLGRDDLLAVAQLDQDEPAVARAERADVVAAAQ